MTFAYNLKKPKNSGKVAADGQLEEPGSIYKDGDVKDAARKPVRICDEIEFMTTGNRKIDHYFQVHGTQIDP